MFKHIVTYSYMNLMNQVKYMGIPRSQQVVTVAYLISCHCLIDVCNCKMINCQSSIWLVNTSPNAASYYFTLRRRMQSIVISFSLCMFVCLSIHSCISKTSPNILLPVAMAQSFSRSILICNSGYVDHVIFSRSGSYEPNFAQQLRQAGT